MTPYYITAIYSVIDTFAGVFKSLFWPLEYNLLELFPGPTMQGIIDTLKNVPIFGDFFALSVFDIAFLSVIAVVLAQILIFIKNLVFGD